MGIKDGDTYKDIEDKSSISSYAQIHGYKVEKLEFDDGRYYIALIILLFRMKISLV